MNSDEATVAVIETVRAELSGAALSDAKVLLNRYHVKVGNPGQPRASRSIKTRSAEEVGHESIQRGQS